MHAGFLEYTLYSDSAFEPRLSFSLKGMRMRWRKGKALDLSLYVEKGRKSNGAGSRRP